MAEKEGLFEVEKWLKGEEKQLPKGKRRNKDYRDRKTELSVLDIIGKEGIAAPELRDVTLKVLELDFELEELFRHIISGIKILYERGGMVHADLSEFNILMKGYAEREIADVNASEIEIEPVIIDMGQSLLLEHPNADAFLKRDVKNIVTFFNKLGLDYSVVEVMRMIKR